MKKGKDSSIFSFPVSPEGDFSKYLVEELKDKLPE